MQTFARQDDTEINDLQEQFFVHIQNSLNQNLSLRFKRFENRDQFYEANKFYFREAELSGDSLIIPYPGHKVKELNRIVYLIPPAYFSKNKNQFKNLTPNINLKFDPEKSTITINNAYPLSYYKSPLLKSDSKAFVQQSLQYLYTMFLPVVHNYSYEYEARVMGQINYRGYKIHDFKIKSTDEWFQFLQILHGQGSLYFFPSRIDDLHEKLVVFGLLYVIKNKKSELYHFGELTLTFSKTSKSKDLEAKLVFYPFIKSIEIDLYE